MRWMFALWIATTAACVDFDRPSELSRDQVLAVRSTPAVIAPGGVARLEALVAGPDGAIDDAALTWSAPGAVIEVDGDGATWLTVPDTAPAGAIDLSLQIETATAELSAIKSVPIEPAELDNPRMVRLEADGVPIEDDGTVRGAAGAVIELSAELERPEAQRLSWFATIGEIDRYHHNPTELAAPDEAGSGWLFAVGRDDRGGVTWRAVPLAFE